MIRPGTQILLFLMITAPAIAATPPAKIAKVPSPNAATLFSSTSTDALAGALRGHLVANVPGVLYESEKDWGKTASVANGVTWTGQKGSFDPKVRHADKKDGTWRSIKVLAPKLADTLVLDIRDLKSPESGRLTFELFVSFDATVESKQEKWAKGLRLYSLSARARLRAKAHLSCGVTARWDNKGTWTPDLVIKPTVTAAHLSYDNLVVEHIAGLGGEAAKLVGDAVKGGLDKWHPSLERELLAKADAALVKAGNLKDVRLTLACFLRNKN